jgi:hypothetical protein
MLMIGALNWGPQRLGRNLRSTVVDYAALQPIAPVQIVSVLSLLGLQKCTSFGSVEILFDCLALLVLIHRKSLLMLMVFTVRLKNVDFRGTISICGAALSPTCSFSVLTAPQPHR